jgi:hypothetical protein
MSATAVFVVGAAVTGLCLAFLWISLHEMKRLGSEPEEKTRARPYL